MPERQTSAEARRTERQAIAADWEESPYYEAYDNSAGLAPFWAPDTAFVRMFSRLDLTSVIDLACGRGRHSERILATPSVRRLYAVDVNESNIAHCRARFRDEPRVECIVNDGCSLTEIADGGVTAIVCYDAMVHFELWDIEEYLREFARVLAPGGRALLHHSNNDREPGNHYRQNVAWRNFMSAPLFSHMSVRAGLEVVEQEVFSWFDAPLSDCLTLVQKPGTPS